MSESGSENDRVEEEEDDNEEEDGSDNAEISVAGYDTTAPSVSIAESEDADDSKSCLRCSKLCLSDESMCAIKVAFELLFADADVAEEATPMLRAVFESSGFIGDAGGSDSADDDDDAFDERPAPAKWGDAADGAFDAGVCCVLSTSRAPNISTDEDEEEEEERESSS